MGLLYPVVGNTRKLKKKTLSARVPKLMSNAVRQHGEAAPMVSQC